MNARLKNPRERVIKLVCRIGSLAIVLALCAAGLGVTQAPARQQPDQPPGEIPEVRYSLPPKPVVTLPPEVEAAAHLNGVPDLPADCNELAPPGGDPPESCVYGFVVQDGLPQAGVQVTLSSDQGQLQVVTQPGPSSSQPYFVAATSWPPLSAEEEDFVSAQASLGGEVTATTFIVQPGSQQVDVWFSSACGPTIVGGLIVVDTIWHRECSPYIVAENLLVYQNTTLTIEPGTTVMFNADKSLRIDGKLLALGDDLAMLQLTANGSTTPGAWAHILFSPTSVDATFDPSGNYTGGSILVFAILDYAGGTSASDKAALRLDASAPFLPYVFIRHSGGDGVRSYNGGVVNINHGAITDSAGWGVYNGSTTQKVVVANSLVARNGNGGIYSTGTTTVWVLGNLIRDNPKNYAVQIYSGYGQIGLNWMDGNAGGIYFGGGASIAQNIIMDSTTNGGIRRQGGTAIINYNVIYRNAMPTNYGGGIYLYSGSGDIHHNVIADNQAKFGGGVVVTTGTANLLNNAILNNSSIDQGGGLYHQSYQAVTFKQNTVLNNQAGAGMGGVYIKKFLLFEENNLYGNSPYDLYNGVPVSSGNFKAEINWWGTANGLQIPQHVWDYLDDSGLSMVDFDPWLAGIKIQAPISPPTGFQATLQGNTVHLSWNANPESDTAGYIVYYDTDETGFPYDGAGALQGDSPILVGNVLNYSLSGLPVGHYRISVTAFDFLIDGQYDQPEGHESWFATEAEVGIGVPPLANFSATPTSGMRPLPVTFTNLSSGDITNCAWDFGDGGTSTSCGSPSHTYVAAGSYTVTLAVSGPAGADTDTRVGYITVSPIPSSANFSGTPTSGVRPLPVTFTNLSSGDYTTCAWTFGDGGTSTSCGSPTRTYNTAGSYTVTLVVNGPGGADTETKTAYIMVTPIPIVTNFSAAPTSGPVPLQVLFTNLSTGDRSSCAWDFGDDGTSASCGNPSHAYQLPGIYTVSLVVTGPGGADTETKVGYISVLPQNPVYMPYVWRK